MARPKGSGNKKNKNKTQEIKQLTKDQVDKKIDENKKIACFGCNELKSKKLFYMSYNPLHIHGRLPYCTDCFRSMICDEEGNVTLTKVQETLQKVDLPFIYNLWKSSMEEEGDTLGIFKKNLALSFKHLTWKDSIFLPEAEKQLNYENIKLQEEKKILFEVTDELIDFFGTGYSNEEYRAMDKKYTFLKNNYPEKTNMHIEALKSYVRYKVKEEIAISQDKVADASKWAELANKAATNAKINPSQLSKADLSDGLSTFSELSQAIEKEVDIIRILPRFKCRPNDALDFNIWCYVNYIRDLQGLPPCEYEDVYAFYDKKVFDYIEQYGDPYEIFTDDTSKKNRESIKKFIKIDEEGV